MTRPLTRAQRAVLETPGHLLVDAGAGSGKTTTVVQALCHQLGVPVLAEGGPVAAVAEPLSFEQVAAITFTNQSAADLKRKLRAALRAGGRPDLASDVDAARIGTIHGFCGDLLRDFALRAGTRPGRTVLTEGEASMLRADSVREVLHSALDRGDLPGLASLLAGRKLRQITEWLAAASEDSDRLARWAAEAGALRPHEQALLALAQRVADRTARELDARGELDFDRMIVATRDLLLDDAVRHAIQRRIRLLVVDEFQDVDPVQRDIAERIGGLADARDPAPARLILVGDPKQSIYRFRRADVTVWNGMAARFAGGDGTVVPLNENFRSKAAILGFVDAVIGAQLDAPVDVSAGRQPFEVDYEPLTARADRHDGDNAVEVLVVPAGEKDKARKADEVREAEAAGIAARLTQLHAEGRAWREMAVLLASWSDVDRYADALGRAGAPVYVRRGEGFWQAREVLDVVLALRVLRDPADDVAMVGFLRSPFVGVRDDTLLALARARGTGAYASVLGTVPHERELLERAQALLAALAPMRDRLPALELLQRLLDESGFLVAAALDRDGDQRVANLRKLVRLAATAPDLSLGEFLREIDLSRAREEKVAPERLYAEGGDVVTITSIHGAKGLEWAVVVWADLVRQLASPTEAFLAGRERFAIKATASPSDEADGKDPVHEAVKALEIMEREAESRRLWYVAATRAKELLILGGIPLGELKADSPAQRIRTALPELSGARDVVYTSHAGTPYHARVVELAVPDAETEPTRHHDTVPAIAHELRLPPAVVEVTAGATRLSATQLMTFARDPAHWHRTYVARFDPALVGRDGRTAGRAIVAGLVVHDVLERIGNDDTEIESLLEQAIARWDEDAPEPGSDPGRQYRAFLRTRIEAAQEAPAWRALAAAPSARRELGFMRIRSDGTAVVGAFDLVARDGDAVRILDLKNSTASTDTLAERYRVQAAVYADAVRAVAGAQDVTFELLALPSAASVVVPPAEDLDGLIARLRAPDAPSAPRPPSGPP